ncbi:Predicted flavoprotein CzcO associated with the cation diffusion facilitator CzcD [Rathayibacter oskolensis]|uniref:Predicted flavoprotein CzcO associated with the cation diffusion facilitator CzcD n=1 Tax=Rathayibacter oskolensis TaxID=1891671 RepID=A0A1X7PJH1_9MICO|nr:FAD-dependent oxidoreductase [Rathayibacter oskolensis]SMH51027.1 Predicted flavoprotein CzcO associated with the cation diffusion facilitator CzcD [Rathayibacter oskolensis]
MTLTLSVPPRADAPRLAGLPVAVIGAGPVGLAAAAQLLERGLDVIVYEAGESAGAAVQQWGHTRLFSPWEYLVDAAAARLLDRAGWEAPAAEELPTGNELVSDYLAPLATTPVLAPLIRYGSRVLAVTREGMDRTRSAGRASTPFLLRVQTSDGVTDVTARAVVDTSGTYSSPNSLASSGLDPIGAADVAEHISHALPDVLGTDRDRFVGKRVLVVGAGHSAANTLIKLARLAREEPGTSVTWAIRGTSPLRVYGSGDDELEERGKLGGVVHDLVREGAITLVDRFEIDHLEPAGDGVLVTGRRRKERASIDADVVVNATGFRPDLDMLREIRLSLDEIVEAPRALATLIDPNLHSCGTVEPHGVAELAHPEPDFFIAGMKSYGRAPTFLLVTGYEQVRSIADELAGNHAAARLVQLVLPETGVCSTGTGTAGGSCCA